MRTVSEIQRQEGLNSVQAKKVWDGERLAASSCSVLLVSGDEHTAECPKCGRLLHAEKIHMDDPHCYFCGENLKIEIASPND